MTVKKSDKIAILGFGVEGKDIVNYLIDQGYDDITIFDKKEKNKLDIKDIDTSKLRFITGINYLKKGLCDFKIIFRSPGVYRYLPEIINAEKSGCTVSSNIKLFFNNFKGFTIGVTGTKGKGTTSTLIFEILKNFGYETYLTGNIGSPPLSILKKIGKESKVVLELSSFQLIDLEKSPNIAVVLNITSDHMDWHKNQKEYVDAKKNIVKHQTRNDYKVLNYDYKIPRVFADLSPSRNYFFSSYSNVNGVYVKKNIIYSDFNGTKVKIGPTDKLLLRGKHNWENVCAAICASQIVGVDIEVIKNTIFSFKGLEHRLELVRDVNGVNFYNDSISTNPQTTIAAVESFSEPITLILGGYDKGLNFDGMVKHLCEKKNLINIILIGDMEEILFDMFKKYKFKCLLHKMGKNKMSKIVNKSYEITKKGGVVLLSPACASFDMFENYKDRGDQFKKEVYTLS